MSDWLDLELARELQPVPAPDGLWGRVQSGRRPPVRNRWMAWRWPAFATAALLIAAITLQIARRTPTFEQVAARELDRSSRLDLRSGDAAEIGTWLHREAGLDAVLPNSSSVQLTGARVIREHGALVGEVAYRVGERSAVLLVARAGGTFRAPAQHGGFSWQKGQQVYALAGNTPDPQAACVLCHASL